MPDGKPSSGLNTSASIPYSSKRYPRPLSRPSSCMVCHACLYSDDLRPGETSESSRRCWQHCPGGNSSFYRDQLDAPHNPVLGPTACASFHSTTSLSVLTGLSASPAMYPSRSSLNPVVMTTPVAALRRTRSAKLSCMLTWITAAPATLDSIAIVDLKACSTSETQALRLVIRPSASSRKFLRTRPSRIDLSEGFWVALRYLLY